MSESAEVSIGLFTAGGSGGGAHFNVFRNLFPPEVKIFFEGLNLPRTSRWGFEGQSDVITQRVVEFTNRHRADGIIITGFPIDVHNPGLETRVSRAVGLPVVLALPAAIAALRAFSAEKLTLMTPFDEEMNARLKKALSEAGFTVLSCPLFESYEARAASKIGPDKLFDRTRDAFREAREAEAIYFQGGVLDPVPIIQRVEDNLGVPVIASNPVMLWCMLSRLGRRYSIPGYGKLFSSWPAAAK